MTWFVSFSAENLLDYHSFPSTLANGHCSCCLELCYSIFSVLSEYARIPNTTISLCVCVHVHSRTAWKQRVCLCVCWRVSMQTNCIVALATALVLVRFVKNSTVLETHHHAVDRNFSLGKGFFIAIARQLSPAKRHIHTSNSLLVIRIRRQ